MSNIKKNDTSKKLPQRYCTINTDCRSKIEYCDLNIKSCNQFFYIKGTGEKGKKTISVEMSNYELKKGQFIGKMYTPSILSGFQYGIDGLEFYSMSNNANGGKGYIITDVAFTPSGSSIYSKILTLNEPIIEENFTNIIIGISFANQNTNPDELEAKFQDIPIYNLYNTCFIDSQTNVEDSSCLYSSCLDTDTAKTKFNINTDKPICSPLPNRYKLTTIKTEEGNVLNPTVKITHPSFVDIDNNYYLNNTCGYLDYSHAYDLEPGTDDPFKKCEGGTYDAGGGKPGHPNCKSCTKCAYGFYNNDDWCGSSAGDLTRTPESLYPPGKCKDGRNLYVIICGDAGILGECAADGSRNLELCSTKNNCGKANPSYAYEWKRLDNNKIGNKKELDKWCGSDGKLCWDLAIKKMGRIDRRFFSIETGKILRNPAELKADLDKQWVATKGDCNLGTVKYIWVATGPGTGNRGSNDPATKSWGFACN